MAAIKIDKIDMSLDDIIKLSKRKKINILKRQPLQNKSNQQKLFGANNRLRIQNKIKGFRSRFPIKGKNALQGKKGVMASNKSTNLIKRVSPRIALIRNNARNQQSNSTKKIVPKNNRINFPQRRLQQIKGLNLQTRSFQQRRGQQINRFRQQGLILQTKSFQQRRLSLQTRSYQQRLSLQTRSFQQRRLQQNSRFQQRRLPQSRFQQRRIQQTSNFQQRRLQTRQNTINKRRGIQTSKVGSIGRSFGFMRSDLIVKRQDQQPTQKTRRWRNNFQQTRNDDSRSNFQQLRSDDAESHGLLTVSVPNNFVQKKQPRINRKFNYNNKFAQQHVVVNKFSERNIDFDSESNTSTSLLGQTALSLHDRFSSSSNTKRIVFM